LNLKLLRGEIIGLVGPSGCGKSTLLRAILGTHPPEQGKVVIHRHEGTEIRKVEADRPGRDRGIVYQRYSLFPHLTACENVAFGPMLDETDIPYRLFRFAEWRKRRGKHLEEAAALLEKLKLGASKDLYPHELSGGMRQRVAIAQALIMKPEILLLDEPFGALDEATREDLQRMLLELYQENMQAVRAGEQPLYTILMVTHELNEALYVSDRVLGLSQYWDWKSAGHDEFPGATIVYDHVTPVYHPNDPRDYATLAEQKEEILRSTFDPEVLQHRDEWLKFWEHLEAGKAKGIAGDVAADGSSSAMS
ncbi:MAG: ATP-binding cassette domain-containing protein, partial [Verrucomicrobiota bacterium]